MASAIQIPLSEYLSTSYRPDREYIEGELRERNVGQWEHARVQWLLALWLGSHEREWNIVGSTARRMQVAPDRIRIPDLVVLRPGPHPAVLSQPPLLTVEILSPDDDYPELERRCLDYKAMGVQTMWIVDPKTRTGRMCAGAEWLTADRLQVLGTPIYVDLQELFARMDSPSPQP